MHEDFEVKTSKNNNILAVNSSRRTKETVGIYYSPFKANIYTSHLLQTRQNVVYVYFGFFNSLTRG